MAIILTRRNKQQPKPPSNPRKDVNPSTQFISKCIPLSSCSVSAFLATQSFNMLKGAPYTGAEGKHCCSSLPQLRAGAGALPLSPLK